MLPELLLSSILGLGGLPGPGSYIGNATEAGTGTLVNEQDNSIMPSSSPSTSDKVQNGDVYDRAVLSTHDVKLLMLPEGAKVERTAPGGSIELYVRKTQAFRGHPPLPMTLQNVRRRMGCASQIDKGKLTVATFGEFSTKEGGARMKLLVRVPAGLAVKTQTGLSGPDSAAQRKADDSDEKGADRNSYWYGPSQAAPDWKTIKTEPDAKRTAK
jgi:hypothetical protein